jgi:putative copper export protein
MFMLNVLSEAMLYLCFSILVGGFTLSIIPETARPHFKLSKSILLAATLGVAFLSFVPVLKLILYLSPDMGLGLTVQSVLLNFEVGKTWVKTGVLSLVLFVYLVPIKLERKPFLSLTGLVLTIVLIILQGWSSHASSLSGWQGAITHTTHFLAITTWTGILIVVSWFSQNHDNWQRFLKWFTPVAIACLALVALTGFELMGYMINEDDYVNSWTLSYGQTLLLKHLAIIPLLVFAFINGILVRKKVDNNPAFNPLPWAKLESVMILLIFAVTGALGQESPPHNIEATINETGVSPLFSFFHEAAPLLPLKFSPGILAVLLFLSAILFLAMLMLTFIKKAPKIMALAMGILFILTCYLALMLSV